MSYEENIDTKPQAEVRKVGKPHTGVPSPEEMQKIERLPYKPQ